MSQKLGRPRRDRVDKYRVQTWFNYVSGNGLRTAYELELEFSPEKFKKDDDGNTTYPCTWAKYRSGRITPNSTLLERVEKRYKGSLYWFNHPIWKLLSDNSPTPDFLKASIAPIKPRLAKILGEYDSKKSYKLLYSERTYNTFYKFDIIRTYARESQRDSVDKIIGALALLADAEVRKCRLQSAYSYKAVICNIDTACNYLPYIRVNDLLECIDARFPPVEYYEFQSNLEILNNFINRLDDSGV